jgi:plasmid replication initiation protein
MGLDRLRGTSVSTNIKTGGQRERAGFGLINDYQIVEYDNRERMASLEIELSRWLYRAVEANEVLSISRDYFRIRKPLDRRIYELARKHTGHQKRWSVSLEVLHRKTGSTASAREFRRAVRSLAESDQLPDYRLTYERRKDQVTIYPRGGRGSVAQVQDLLASGHSSTGDLFDR